MPSAFKSYHLSVGSFQQPVDKGKRFLFKSNQKPFPQRLRHFQDLIRVRTGQVTKVRFQGLQK